MKEKGDLLFPEGVKLTVALTTLTKTSNDECEATWSDCKEPVKLLRAKGARQEACRNLNRGLKLKYVPQTRIFSVEPYESLTIIHEAKGHVRFDVFASADADKRKSYHTKDMDLKIEKYLNDNDFESITPDLQWHGKEVTAAPEVQWSIWNGQNWQIFKDEDRDLLEYFHRSKWKSIKTKDLSFNKEYGTLYEFDFKKMIQRNTESRTERPMRRKILKFESLVPETQSHRKEVQRIKQNMRKVVPEEGVSAAPEVQWTFLDGEDWRPFKDADRDLLEWFYRRVPLSQWLKTIEWNEDYGTLYHFDFRAMTQKNLENGVIRQIHRDPPPPARQT